MRSVYEAAGAEHTLHLLTADDEECLPDIHRRNREKPEGVYQGQISDELFHAVTRHFVPPGEDQGFRVVWHRTADEAPADLHADMV